MNTTTLKLCFFNFIKEHGLTNEEGELTENGFKYIQAEIMKLPYEFDQCIIHAFNGVDLCEPHRDVLYRVNTILEDRFARRGATRYIDCNPLSVCAFALDCKLRPGKVATMLVIGFDMKIRLDETDSTEPIALTPGVSVCKIEISFSAEATSL